MRLLSGSSAFRVAAWTYVGGLLGVLARRPQQVFTRSELLATVFDAGDDPGSVDTYVYYLRRKLGRDAIRTVHGLGYRWGST